MIVFVLYDNSKDFAVIGIMICYFTYPDIPLLTLRFWEYSITPNAYVMG